MIYKPYKYQEHAFQHMLDNPYSGVFMDMGLGKTVVSLTYLNRLIYQEAEYRRALIVGPKRVIKKVWPDEIHKWDHLKHLKYSIVWGSEKERIAALRKDSDIYLINRENIPWLCTLFQSKFPFPIVILDESSSFKSHKSQRFRAIKLARPYIDRLTLLSGTPAPNSLLDLWSQIYLLDEGERLEKNISGFRERYFAQKNPGQLYSGYRIRKDAADAIHDRISDICISMKTEDYLDLPELIVNDIHLDLDDNVQELYDKFEEENIISLANQEITAVNAAALSNKLLQFSNGALYHPDKSYSVIHDIKLDALEEIVEESIGKPILLFYTYKHDEERIRKRFPFARKLNTNQDIEDWNNGKIPLLIAHPASASHGLNLQQGGHIIVWFGLTWSLELYAQAIKRLHRQGQLHTVIIHRLIADNTMDIDVVRALEHKMAGQDALMEAIKARVNMYKSR